MPDDPLVINPVADKATVNPALDATITTPKQRQKLSENFDSFWKEKDAEASAEPPTAPKEDKEAEPKELTAEEVKDIPERVVTEKPKEDKEEKKAPEAPIEAKETKPKAEPEKEVTGKADDLDSLEPHPAASEENKGHFKQLKEAAKALREKTKAWERLAPALQELGFSLSDNPEELSRTIGAAVERIRGLKNGALSPETQTELEGLRQLARSVGVLQSEEFARDYVKPVETAYLDVIDEMSKYFPADPEVIKKDFTEPLKRDFRPHQLTPEWWDQQVEVMKCPNSTKRKIEQKIANVLSLQEKHDLKARELSENKDSYAEWNKKAQEEGARAYQNVVRDEVTQISKDDEEIAALLPAPEDGVTDPEKLEAIKKRNARFPELEKQFRDFLMDSSSGPRSATRRALEYVKVKEGLAATSEKLATRDEELKTLKEASEAKQKALEEEIVKLKTEVTAKRRTSDVPMKPSAGTGAKPTQEKAKLPKDTRGSLREAFDAWKL